MTSRRDERGVRASPRTPFVASVVGSTLVLGLAAAAGCAVAQPAAADGDGALRPGERTLVGAGVDYPADRELRAAKPGLDASMRARRAAGWKAVARALQPVAIASADVKDDAGATPTLPLFRTWYGKDDIDRIFGRVYGALTPEQRKARTPLSEAQIADGFAWNATERGAWTDNDYLARLAQLQDRDFVEGLGGNSRVSYSPGFVRHVLSDYGSLTGCRPRLSQGFPFDAPPPSETNFAPCMSEEFDASAALVKASWWNAAFALPTHDTGAATLAGRRTGELDQGGWGKGEREIVPPPGSVYTVRTSDGNAYRMPALHLATKELREWFWVTIFWSPEPDTDFGEDRPDAIRALGGPWSNYKMCVVSAYDEEDEDPRGGYEGSLGDALAATHEASSKDGKRGPSWCSNPYIERGKKNAQTNCIGCHEHAGETKLNSEAILADEARFPRSGRAKVRQNFPTDYVWSINDLREGLINLFEKRIQHYDQIDR